MVEIFTRLVQQVRSVDIRWIPAHSGITGNEEANRLVKEALGNLPAETDAATSETRCKVKYIFAALTRYIRQRYEEAVEP